MNLCYAVSLKRKFSLKRKREPYKTITLDNYLKIYSIHLFLIDKDFIF